MQSNDEITTPVCLEEFTIYVAIELSGKSWVVVEGIGHAPEEFENTFGIHHFPCIPFRRAPRRRFPGRVLTVRFDTDCRSTLVVNEKIVFSNRGTHMNKRKWTIPEWLKPGLYGAVVGAAALAIVGFTWGGWVTGGTVGKLASEQARNAVVSKTWRSQDWSAVETLA